MKKLKFIFAVLVLITTCSAFPALTAAAGLPLKISVYEDQLLSYAKKNGHFSRAGVEVEIVFSSVATRLVMLGQTDACAAGIVSAVELYLTGEDVEVLAQFSSPAGFYGISRFPPSEASKIMAAAGVAGGGSGMRLRATLKYLGVKDAKFERSGSSDADRYKLLEAGKTDLILINDRRLLSRIRASGKYYVIEPRDAYKGKKFVTAVFARKAVVKDRSREFELLVSALHSALADIAATPGPFIDFLAAEKGLTRQEAAETQSELVRGAAETGLEPDEAFADSLVSEAQTPGGRKARKSAAGLAFRDYAVKAKKAAAGTGGK